MGSGFSKMKKQAKLMQEQFGQMQNKLKDTYVTGSAGAGLVTVTINGEKMLTKIAELYEEQIDAAVTGLTSVIEPLIIGFLGIVIGGIVLALFLPIFKIPELIH